MSKKPENYYPELNKIFASDLISDEHSGGEEDWNAEKDEKWKQKKLISSLIEQKIPEGNQLIKGYLGNLKVIIYYIKTINDGMVTSYKLYSVRTR